MYIKVSNTDDLSDDARNRHRLPFAYKNILTPFKECGGCYPVIAAKDHSLQPLC